MNNDEKTGIILRVLVDVLNGTNIYQNIPCKNTITTWVNFRHIVVNFRHKHIGVNFRHKHIVGITSIYF